MKIQRVSNWTPDVIYDTKSNNYEVLYRLPPQFKLQLHSERWMIFASFEQLPRVRRKQYRNLFGRNTTVPGLGQSFVSHFLKLERAWHKGAGTGEVRTPKEKGNNSGLSLCPTKYFPINHQVGNSFLVLRSGKTTVATTCSPNYPPSSPSPHHGVLITFKWINSFVKQYFTEMYPQVSKYET